MMKYFETLYIVNPNFEQNRLDTIIKDVEKSVGKFSNILAHNVWGKKRLAYQIDNQKYGTFVLLHFETEEASRIAGFESYMKLNTSVLRAQIIRLKSRPSETVLEKSISSGLKVESQHSVEEKYRSSKLREHSSADDDSTESVKDENMTETDEGESIPDAINTDTDSEQE